MKTKIDFLKEQIKDEGIGFVDTQVLLSIMELKKHFTPEIIQAVEDILSLPSPPKTKEIEFDDFCKKKYLI